LHLGKEKEFFQQERPIEGLNSMLEEAVSCWSSSREAAKLSDVLGRPSVLLLNRSSSIEVTNRKKKMSHKSPILKGDC
jgi:hypothetical protein